MNINDKYGKLTVLEIKKGRFIKVKCDCGNIKEVRKHDVKNGRIKSCGCIRKNKPNSIKHGLSNTKLYVVFKAMKQRCYNLNCKNYSEYGSRGIKIFEEWLNDYTKFHDWALNNGYKEGLYIDRINNNGNYEPSNCRWISNKKNTNNTRKNNHILYKNKTYTIQEFSEFCKISRTTLVSRLKLGWNLEKIVNTKPSKGRNQYK
ncbi:MAG: hypothetical protein WC346_19060 [Methanogenium sp.]|jgi:hypothetical protein